MNCDDNVNLVLAHAKHCVMVRNRIILYSVNLVWDCCYVVVRSANNTEQQKMQLVEKQQLHLKTSSEARIYMNACINRTKAVVPTDALLTNQCRDPLSGPICGHYCFDFAQQVYTDVPSLLVFLGFLALIICKNSSNGLILQIRHTLSVTGIMERIAN